MTAYFLLLLTGFAGGVLAGLLGLGGGIFYILVLPSVLVWFGIPLPETAPFVVANSLAGIAIASATSLFMHRKELKNYLGESLLVGIPAVAASLVVTRFVVHSPWFSTRVFSVMVILLMLLLLVQMFFGSGETGKTVGEQRIPPAKGMAAGTGSGAVSALSGLGGGIILIPVLQVYFRQGVRKTKIISLATIFISSAFISLQNLVSIPDFPVSHLAHTGYILPAVALPLIAGVLAGSPLGVRVSKRLDDLTLKRLFMVFVLLVMAEKTVSLFLTW